jgi:hypothetical protein
VHCISITSTWQLQGKSPSNTPHVRLSTSESCPGPAQPNWHAIFVLMNKSLQLQHTELVTNQMHLLPSVLSVRALRFSRIEGDKHQHGYLLTHLPSQLPVTVLHPSSTWAMCVAGLERTIVSVYLFQNAFMRLFPFFSRV